MSESNKYISITCEMQPGKDSELNKLCKQQVCWLFFNRSQSRANLLFTKSTCCLCCSDLPFFCNIQLPSTFWFFELSVPQHLFSCLFQHANEDVEKMILGNKCDMEDKRQVANERGMLVSVCVYVCRLYPGVCGCISQYVNDTINLGHYTCRLVLSL